MANHKRRGLGSTYVDEIFEGAPAEPKSEPKAKARKKKAASEEPAPAAVEKAAVEAAAPAPEPAVEAMPAEAAPAAPEPRPEPVTVETTARVETPEGESPRLVPLPPPVPLRLIHGEGPLLPRIRDTVRSWTDLVAEARAAVLVLRERYPGTGLLGLCESALRHELERLRREYNHGRPFEAPEDLEGATPDLLRARA